MLTLLTLLRIFYIFKTLFFFFFSFFFYQVLSHYGIVLNQRSISPPFSGDEYRDASWNSFRSGTVLACVLHYFCGGHGGGTGMPPMDLGRIYFTPRTAAEFHDNVAAVFEMMLRLRLPLLWTVDNFIAFPNVDFLLWQLHALYLMFRDQVKFCTHFTFFSFFD